MTISKLRDKSRSAPLMEKYKAMKEKRKVELREKYAHFSDAAWRRHLAQSEDGYSQLVGKAYCFLREENGLTDDEAMEQSNACINELDQVFHKDTLEELTTYFQVFKVIPDEWIVVSAEDGILAIFGCKEYAESFNAANILRCFNHNPFC